MTTTDDYTGDVYVGGPVALRTLPALSIAKLAVGRMSNNVYLLRCRATGDGLLIDADDEPDKVMALVHLAPGGVSTIVTTHQHADHWGALAAVVAETGARTMAGSADVGGIPVPTDRALQHGDVVHVGQIELGVIALRGHTPGSVTLSYADPGGVTHLFTGDSLFPGGLGKTWKPADFDSLYADVVGRVFDVFDDQTWFYPGHGTDSTLGAERPHLTEWRERGW